MKVQKLNEALNFGDANVAGRGACSPTAIDVMKTISDAIAYLNDDKYDKIARSQLKYCAETLLDNKQSFENFNDYWQERFPAMINLIDSQLEKIPAKIIASVGFDSMEEDLSDRIRKNDLEGDDGSYWASEDNIDIDIQDRERHTHEFGSITNQWGRSFVGNQLNKQPKVATQTWGRVWKNGKFDKSFEGPKYQVRAEMAKYLDSK